MSQKNVLKLYSFLATHPTEAALKSAWANGDSFSLTLLPHPTAPALVSLRDMDDYPGFTYVYLTDPRSGARATIPMEGSNEEDAPAEAASRAGERTETSGYTGPDRRVSERRAKDIFLDFLGEEVHEDRELYQAALTLLASMMASSARMDDDLETLVEEAVEAAGLLLNKFHED